MSSFIGLSDVTCFASAAPPPAILEESLELVALRGRRGRRRKRREGGGGGGGEEVEKGEVEGKEEEFPPENFDTNADRRLCWELGEECVPVRDKALRARWDLRSHPDGLRPQVEVKTRHLLAPPRPRVRPSPVGGSRGVTLESLGGQEAAGFDRPPTRNEVRRSGTSVLDFCLFVLQQLVSSQRDFC